MTIVLNAKNINADDFSKHIKMELRKLDKYFLIPQRFSCKISKEKNESIVKISLNTNGKYFSGQAKGTRIGECIRKAIMRITRKIEAKKSFYKRKRRSRNKSYAAEIHNSQDSIENEH